jgi:hypothetical protein
LDTAGSEQGPTAAAANTVKNLRSPFTDDLKNHQMLKKEALLQGIS